ncbi:peptidase M24 [Arthrobacter sp. MYb224]|uniref:M24 family metallopeptidase n=1 Tax=Arthrobacter sp. MYb224 TaxID=1848600 RepID=UPI000CFCD99A|nr:M24 family metallopeptidase [Arthrobacter sp. MYb224]PQZ97711.1 peptidase M24 [Arthrobacter sp. MYb224]
MPLNEYNLKHAQLVDLLDELGADAILLSTAGTLSWYLAGARTHVSLAGPPALRVLVHREGCEIATPLSEADRLLAEELRKVPEARLHILDWHESLDDYAAWCPEVRGLEVLSEARVEVQLRGLRTVLSDAEVSRYRGLCVAVAGIFTQVLGEASPEDSERDIAARLSAAAISLGGEVLVALVCGDSRSAFRHPLPTKALLGRKAMAVLCVRRGGLIANVTRWVRFGDPLPGELEAEHAILQVEHEIFRSLQPGTELRSMLPVVQAAYPLHGFDPQEWQNHHQGGIAGYNGRDPRLTPDATDLIRPNQAFAWNPSAVQDAMTFKVEDTVLLIEHGGKPTVEVLSVDPRWPVIRVGNLDRPAVLAR